MYYIIDANNLAGEMGIIKQPDFDKTVVDKLCEFHSATGRKVVLIFDGRDSLGDNFVEQDIRIIYTPRDKYYMSADDKILEYAEKMFDPRAKVHEEVFVVTNDLEIHEKIRQLNLGKRLDIKITKAKDFVTLMEDKKEFSDEKEGLEDMNDELLKIWTK